MWCFFIPVHSYNYSAIPMKLVQVQLVKRIADINGIRWINGNNKIVRDEMKELKKYRN